MEKIQSHDVKDIWRLREGLLLEVHKYENIRYVSVDKKYLKVVRGCKGLCELREDFTDTYNKITYSKGDLIYGNFHISILIDSSYFRFEIKSSGGSVYGSGSDIDEVLNNIKIIISTYN